MSAIVRPNQYDSPDQTNEINQTLNATRRGEHAPHNAVLRVLHTFGLVFRRGCAWAVACTAAAFLSSAAFGQTPPSNTIFKNAMDHDGVVECAPGQLCPIYSEELYNGGAGGDTGANSGGRKIDLDDDRYYDYNYIQFNGFLTPGDRDSYWIDLPNGQQKFYLYFLEPSSAYGSDGQDATPSLGVSIKTRLFPGSTTLSFVDDPAATDGDAHDSSNLGNCENCFSRFAGVDPFLGNDPRNRPAVIVERSALNIPSDRRIIVHVTDESNGNGIPAGGDGLIRYGFRVGHSLPSGVQGNGDGTFNPVPLPPAAWALGGALGLFGVMGAARRRRA